MCVRVCVLYVSVPLCRYVCAVDSTYQPLTVAWAGVLLVWQPLPLPSPPPALQLRPPHSHPLHRLQFQPTASCPTNTCTHMHSAKEIRYVLYTHWQLLKYSIICRRLILLCVLLRRSCLLPCTVYVTSPYMHVVLFILSFVCTHVHTYSVQLYDRVTLSFTTKMQAH